MGETEKLDKAPKESWFTGLSAEFKKIIWPEKQSLVRQTTAVIAVSVVLAGRENDTGRKSGTDSVSGTGGGTVKYKGL